MAAIEHSSPEKAGSMDLKKADVEHSEKKIRESIHEAGGRSRYADYACDNARLLLKYEKMYLIVLCICCCSGDSGFDGTVMGGVNSMAQYQQFFGLSSAGAKTGIVFGIYTWITCLCHSLCVGAIITGTAKNQATFIGGRFLTGIGSGTAGACAKSYLAEITPPQTRGLFLGLLNSFYYVGQMTATGMMVSTGKFNNNLSWRLPLFVQIIPAAFNVIFVFLCPESPRWLYTIGKVDKARDILAKLHSNTGDPYSPLIDLEMEEIKEKIVLGGSDKHFWDFRPLFRTAADRYRAWMVVLIGSFGQLSGNGLITYFLPVLLKNAGIVSQNRQLTLNFVNSVTSFIGALSGSASVDHIGRRKLLLISTGLCVVTLAIVTGLLSDNGNGNQVRANAGISFIYLFMVIFSFGWTPMQSLYGAEVLSYEARAKGLAFLNVVAQASSCINTFGIPVALEKLGWKGRSPTDSIHPMLANGCTYSLPDFPDLGCL
ncbi:hypothetical protein EWM64_g2102 [Hericium alpestre]|uniref:Major facilitator superfamily (MFS) profile domain-containing protein n=1 Tax=Hericium alpestre TaxID=135208 RepID=A0A4Z0A4F5_9AGAM|nr:hypothetical protein EWM64_g2102 [Hericium alpestre]